MTIDHFVIEFFEITFTFIAQPRIESTVMEFLNTNSNINQTTR